MQGHSVGLSIVYRLFLIVACFPLLLPATPVAPAAASVSAQTARIQKLIDALARLKTAKFIRNGSVHGVAEAVSHMHRKWQWKRKQIKTAEDFIRIVGTGSSMTGKPYQIEFADGRRINSADWFRQQLKKLSR